MKIEAVGWSRRIHTYHLATADLKKSVGKPGFYQQEKVYLYRESIYRNGIEERGEGVIIECKTYVNRMDGNYLTTINFTKEDVVRIFLCAFKDNPFGALVKLVAEQLPKRRKRR